MALESRLKLAAANATRALPSAVQVVSKPEDAARIKQLEQERDGLLKKLELANKESSGRESKAAATRVEELQNQLAAMRSRLEVIEARPVPYTPEELALFKRPEAKISELAGKKSVRELPPGTAKLVAEAERYFSARQLDKAEEKYLQVLAQDQKNAPALANLRAIELELHKLDKADAHISQAIALAPNDAYNLSILGYCKFLQEKYDDALDALS